MISNISSNLQISVLAVHGPPQLILWAVDMKRPYFSTWMYISSNSKSTSSLSWGRNQFSFNEHTFQRSSIFEVPTKSCPAKQTKRIKASERNAAPKEIPRMDVLPGNKKEQVSVGIASIFLESHHEYFWIN